VESAGVVRAAESGVVQAAARSVMMMQAAVHDTSQGCAREVTERFSES
jgi:hypothetical protein